MKNVQIDKLVLNKSWYANKVNLSIQDLLKNQGDQVELKRDPIVCQNDKCQSLLYPQLKDSGQMQNQWEQNQQIQIQSPIRCTVCNQENPLNEESLEFMRSYINEKKVMKTVQNVNNPDQYQVYVYCIDTSESMSQEFYQPISLQQFLPINFSQNVRERLGQPFLAVLRQMGIVDEMILYLNLETFLMFKTIFESDGANAFYQLFEDMMISGQLQLKSGVQRREIIIDILMENLKRLLQDEKKSKKTIVLFVFFDVTVRILNNQTLQLVELDPSKLDSLEECMLFGQKSYENWQPQFLINQQEQILKILQNINTRSGGTCMGSAIAVSLGILNKINIKPTQIIIFTDGKTNVGLCRTEYEQSISQSQLIHDDKLEKDSIKIAQEAQKLNTSVSIISFKHESVSFSKLETISKNSGGRFYQISIESPIAKTELKKYSSYARSNTLNFLDGNYYQESKKIY